MKLDKAHEEEIGDAGRADRPMQLANRELNHELDKEIRSITQRAKAIQLSTGCTWGEALRQVDPA